MPIIEKFLMDTFVHFFKIHYIYSDNLAIWKYYLSICFGDRVSYVVPSGLELIL